MCSKVVLHDLCETFIKSANEYAHGRSTTTTKKSRKELKN